MISAILFRTISLAHEDSLADVLKIGLTGRVLENHTMFSWQPSTA